MGIFGMHMLNLRVLETELTQTKDLPVSWLPFKTGTIEAMKAVIQRVSSASVKVVETGKVSGSIDAGLFILLGVKEGDTKEQASEMAEKIAKLRIMPDNEDKMNLSILDAKGKILVVSQFTLYADTSKGNRPSFIKAAKPDLAEKIYEEFITKLKELGIEVATGSFGDYMEIQANLDGPVTINIQT